jgi:hypothetical protein
VKKKSIVKGRYDRSLQNLAKEKAASLLELEDQHQKTNKKLAEGHELQLSSRLLKTDQVKALRDWDAHDLKVGIKETLDDVF